MGSFEHAIPAAAIKGVVKPIGPEEAERLLALNDRNRPLSASWVSRLASDMLAGRWMVTGEPIVIASDGRLLDGQHRLHAVISSGRTVNALIVEGIDPAAHAAMGQSKRRTLGHVVSMLGGKNYNVAASIVALAWNIDNLTPVRWMQFSMPNEHGSTVYLRDRDAFDTAASITTSLRRGGHAILTPKIAGWLAYVSNGEAESWLGRVSSAVGLQPHTGAHLLYQRDQAELGKTAKLPWLMCLALTCKAYAADHQNRQIRTLRWIEGTEEFPMLSPRMAPRLGHNKGI